MHDHRDRAGYGRGATAQAKRRFRYELVRGELRKILSAGSKHGYVALRIASRLERHVDTNVLGRVYAVETGFLISRRPNTVRTPNTTFVSHDRVEAAGRMEGYWHCAPDLAAEVVSSKDTHTGVTEKVLA